MTDTRDHPLEGTLSRLGSLGAPLTLASPFGRRTVPADQLARPGPELADALARYTETVGADRQVAASQFSKHWAASVARTAFAAYAAEQRVPDVAAGNSAVVFDDSGRPAGLQLVVPRFAALPGDPDADCPTAEVVPDEPGLRTWLRAQAFDGHLTAVVDATAAVAPVEERRLWANVAAACAGAFSALSGRQVDADRLRSDATALLDAADAPTRGLVRLVPVRHAGKTRLFVQRETCCLRYRLHQAPPPCLSCPLLSEGERRRRIVVRLSQPEA